MLTTKNVGKIEINERTDKRTDGRTNERTNERTDERTDGRTDERTHGWTDLGEDESRLELIPTRTIDRRRVRVGTPNTSTSGVL